MVDLSDDTWRVISEVARWLKYVFAGATTALSILSLRYETTIKGDDPNQRKTLTGAGRWYQRGVLALAAVTIATTIAGDIADSRVSKAAAVAAEARYQAVLKEELRGQLQDGIKPILDNLGTQVTATSTKVTTDLLLQSKKSAQDIVKQQKLVRSQLESSSKTIGDLESSVEASVSRTSVALNRLQSSVTEAGLRVTDFHLEIALNPRKNRLNRPPDPRAAKAELASITKANCDLEGRAPNLVNPKASPCDLLAQTEQRWPNTHFFAERLFMGPELETRISLLLNGPQIELRVGDCGRFAVPRSSPLPCVVFANMLAFEQLPGGGARGVPIPFTMIPGDPHYGEGISIHYDKSGETLKTRRVLGQDFLLRDSLRFAVCAEGQGDPYIRFTLVIPKYTT